VSRVELKITPELLLNILKVQNDASDVVAAYLNLDGPVLVLLLEVPDAPAGAASMEPIWERVPWNAPDTVHLKHIAWYDKDKRKVER
jgi:hypothetical protein